MMKKLEIIYEDDHILAVNKPAGLLTIPDRFRQDIPNLKTMLTHGREELYTVHRLDRQTSGGILFAKTLDAHKHLSQQFMDREPEKYYVAIVDGILRNKEGEIDQPLAESMSTRGKMLIHQRGKPSRTAYSVISEHGNFSYIQLRIYTGRLHQIRVHMAHIGHPLMVDELYGKREAFFLSEIKRKKFNLKKGEEERPLLTRQPLHSQRLIIKHPNTEEKIDLEFPSPKDISAVLRQLRKIYG